MLPKIALIAARQSLESTIRPADAGLSKKCELLLLPYDRLSEVAGLYQANRDACDGFLFSGWLPYSLAAGNGGIDKPHDYFRLSEEDFYRTMFRVCAENPGVDLSRVMVDDPEFETDFRDLMPERRRCLVTTCYPLEFAMQAVSSAGSADEGSLVYGVALGVYLSAWKMRRVDVIVTRLANLSPALTEHGIKHYLLAPSRATIADCADRLVNRINSGNYADMLLVSGILETEADRQEEFVRILSVFNRQSGMNLVLSRENGRIRITTSNRHFRLLTGDLTDCRVSQALREKSACAYALGWGVGYDLQSAHANAQKALKIARHTGSRCTFAVTEQGRVVGPLLSHNRIVFEADTDRQTEELCRRYDISRLHLKRIHALIASRKSSVFTSDELAESLGISPRSARRILLRLSESGGAELAEPEDTGLRGRPAQRYCIRLE